MNISSNTVRGYHWSSHSVLPMSDLVVYIRTRLATCLLSTFPFFPQAISYTKQCELKPGAVLHPSAFSFPRNTALACPAYRTIPFPFQTFPSLYTAVLSNATALVAYCNAFASISLFVLFGLFICFYSNVYCLRGLVSAARTVPGHQVELYTADLQSKRQSATIPTYVLGYSALLPCGIHLYTTSILGYLYRSSSSWRNSIVLPHVILWHGESFIIELMLTEIMRKFFSCPIVASHLNLSSQLYLRRAPQFPKISAISFPDRLRASNERLTQVFLWIAVRESQDGRMDLNIDLAVISRDPVTWKWRLVYIGYK